MPVVKKRRTGRHARRLTPAQDRFCREYLVDLIASAAYRRSYPKASQATADSHGYRLLTWPHIQQRIAELRAEQSRRTDIRADAVLEELRRIGFADLRNVMSWGPDGARLLPSDGLDTAVAAAVKKVKQVPTEDGERIEIELHDKIAALTKLGQHLGLFVERHEHSGTDGQPIRLLIRSLDELGDGVELAHVNGKDAGG